MKINAIWIDTDLGRRMIKIDPPIEVNPYGSMPSYLQILATEGLWGLVQRMADAASPTPDAKA